LSTSRDRFLTKRVEELVPHRIRRQGRAYYLSGAVQFARGDAGSIEATVKGTMPYLVFLRLEPQENLLTCSCTCPFFSGHYEACKHIWATMLEAENRWLLGDAARMGELILDFYDSRIFRDDQDLSEEEDQEAGSRPDWEKKMSIVEHSMAAGTEIDRESWTPDRQIIFVLDIEGTLQGHGLNIEVGHRRMKKSGAWSKLKVKKWDQREINTLPDPDDRKILSLLMGGYDPHVFRSFNYYGGHSARSFELPQATHRIMVRLMCETGRGMMRRTALADELLPITWDDGPAWQFVLEIKRASGANQFTIKGNLRRGDQCIPLTEPTLLTAGGIVLLGQSASALEFGSKGGFAWISLLRREGTITVPAAEVEKLLEKLLALPELPTLDLAPELNYSEETIPPRPLLKVRAPKYESHGVLLEAFLSFDYGGAIVEADGPRRGVYRPEERRFLKRSDTAEREALLRLKRLGLKSMAPHRQEHEWHFELIPKRLARVVGVLTEAGWQVEAEGKVFRQASTLSMSVESGIDWFELHGEIEFGDQVAHLPELLRALKSGEETVQLGDGTFGILPEDWLKRFGTIGSFGDETEDHIRFRPTQVALLDALLAAMPEVKIDDVFRKARARMQGFDGVKQKKETASFQGTLRDYQRDGLGWLNFLLSFGFGGCLADDMGLGKTVQVLALVEARRLVRNRNRKKPPAERIPPSLIVVPKSLVYNWRQEAKRFCPKLKVHDHTGIDRFGRDAEERDKKSIEHFDDYDVILTTYGTLRRDAAVLKEKRFDLAILDEAQAIKNAGSATAKAARLLQADNRIALSGTPIENHLGELWSLFEFLNPGMLGSGRAGALFLANKKGTRDEDRASRKLLAQALRPFILRRTKEQVARDLPEKLEQTMYCELEPKQRSLYDELRDHYRSLLLNRIETEGLNKSKIQVLEALLRLRQAACHPALVDKTNRKAPSAKLSVLLPRLAEVIDEGHKALVFSQFTSMLSLVREELDKEGTIYEYLDGRTRKRHEKVERFQSDPDCKLFLISLKAGGLGLNLTAADYVFLLDPWWNPAVEAQAIDRAHRIGQTRPVFAYRLIARDTVEEKVLELQDVKRDLADAIINSDNRLIRRLTREDLENLLG